MVFISPDHKAGYFWGGVPWQGVCVLTVAIINEVVNSKKVDGDIRWYTPKN